MSGENPFTAGRGEVSGHEWQPRRSYVLRLAEEGEERPFLAACRRYEEKSTRLDEIRSEYSEACRRLLRQEQEVAELLAVAQGERRTGRAKMMEIRTEEMEKAEQELPEARAALDQVRERVEELEQEFSEIAEFLDRHFIPVAERRTQLPSLPDRDAEISRYGSRPGPRELDPTAVAMESG